MRCEHLGTFEIMLEIETFCMAGDGTTNLQIQRNRSKADCHDVRCMCLPIKEIFPLMSGTQHEVSEVNMTDVSLVRTAEA